VPEYAPRRIRAHDRNCCGDTIVDAGGATGNMLAHM
jgi:hypothetical protein